MARRVLPLLALAGGCGAARVLVAGDSWGSEGGKPLEKVLQGHKPETKVTNIAVGGSTAQQWSSGSKLTKLVNAAKDADYIWFSAMGNDAIAFLPGCGLLPNGNSAQDCGDKFIPKVMGWMRTIMTAVQKANPNVKLVGFGYDVMGMSNLPLCPAMADALFPGCIGGDTAADGTNRTRIECWNNQCNRLQTEAWTGLAQEFDVVETVNLLGTLQAASGDKSASPGHPDMSKFGPTGYMQANCIHANAKGWPIIFEKMYDLYWSKYL